MQLPQIKCYQPTVAGQGFTFYLLSKGANAGQPNHLPWVNSFAIHCSSRNEYDYYFWLSYSLWQSGRFRPLLRGTAVPFISVSDVRKLINEVAPVIASHWQHYLGVIQSLNKVQSAKAYLAEAIISADKLQKYLLSIYF